LIMKACTFLHIGICLVFVSTWNSALAIPNEKVNPSTTTHISIDELDEEIELPVLDEDYGTGTARETDPWTFDLWNPELTIGGNVIDWKHRGFARFDLSDLLVGSDITDVSITFYVHLPSGNNQYTLFLKSMDVLPDGDNACEVWNSMDDDYTDDGSDVIQNEGEHTLNLNENAVSALQRALDDGDEWFGVSFCEEFDSCAYGAVDGYDEDTSPTLTVTYEEGGWIEAPSEVTLTAQGEYLLDLTWTDNSEDETAFFIEGRYREVDEDPWEDWEPQDTVDANVTSWGDTIDTPGEYQYRLNARNDEDISAWVESNELTHEYIPFAPSNAAVTYQDSGDMVITWSDESQIETGFIIQQSYSIDNEGWGDFTDLDSAIVAPDSEFYALTPGTGGYYRYRVAAFNDFISSEWAITDTAYAPPVPGMPSDFEAVFDLEEVTILLYWFDNSLTESGFRIERMGTADGDNWTDWELIKLTDPDVTSYLDVDVSLQFIYRYRLSAENLTGVSDWFEAEVKTKSALSEQTANRPLRTKLYAPFPNPLYGEATVLFDLAKRGVANISLYTLEGRLVRRFTQSVFPEGKHRYSINITDLSSGSYFLGFKSDGVESTRKIILF